MNCQKCGSPVETGASFCRTCGAQLFAQPVADQTMAAAQPTVMQQPVVDQTMVAQQQPAVMQQPVVDQATTVQQPVVNPTTVAQQPVYQQPTQNNVAKPAATNNKALKILSYLGILVCIPLFSKEKDDPSVKFHIGQGLVCFAMQILILLTDRIVISNVFRTEVKYFGIGTGVYTVSGLGHMIRWALYLVGFVLVLIGIANAASEKDKEVPIIGKFAFYK